MTARMATFYAAHNEYLEQLLTTGILGLAAWLLLVAAHLRRGERSWNTPGVAPVMLALCSYLAQAVVSIRVSMVFPLVMLLFGALAALTAPELPQPAAPAPRGKKQQKPEPLPPKNAWYFAKTVLAAVLCMAAAKRHCAAAVRLSDGIKQRRGGTVAVLRSCTPLSFPICRLE